MLMTQLAKSFLEHGQGKLRKVKKIHFCGLLWFSLHLPQHRTWSELPHFPLPQAPADETCCEGANQKQPQQTPQTSPPSRASPGTFMLSFRGELLFSSCPQSLPELRCRCVSITAVPGCTYPANAVQTVTHSPSPPHHNRPLLPHIPALPPPGCAQPVQLLFTTDTTYHRALWLQAHAGSLFCLLGSRKQDTRAHTDTRAFCCILPHALPDDHLQR